MLALPILLPVSAKGRFNPLAYMNAGKGRGHRPIQNDTRKRLERFIAPPIVGTVRQFTSKVCTFGCVLCVADPSGEGERTSKNSANRARRLCLMLSKA